MSGHSKHGIMGRTASETVLGTQATAGPYQQSQRTGGSTGEGKPMTLTDKKTRRTTNTCRQDTWQKILQEAAIWYNPNLVIKTSEAWPRISHRGWQHQ